MPDAVARARADEELIAATAAGDRSAFERFVTRHQGSVYRLARAITHDDAAAEDVLQETFVAVFTHAGDFRGDASGRSWLFAIARHAAWKVAHRAGFGRPVEDASIEQLGLAAGWGTEDAEQEALAAERAARLTAALAALAPEDREILVLRDLEGLSGAETAVALGIGLAAQKSRLHRARLRLEAALRAQHDEEGGRDVART